MKYFLCLLFCLCILKLTAKDINISFEYRIDENDLKEQVGEGLLKIINRSNGEIDSIKVKNHKAKLPDDFNEIKDLLKNDLFNIELTIDAISYNDVFFEKVGNDNVNNNNIHILAIINQYSITKHRRLSMGIVNIIICVILGGIYTLSVEQYNNQDDYGLVYIGIGMFFWACIAFYTCLDTYREDIMHYFSVINNVFFLLSLPYFKYGSGFIYKLVNNKIKKWNITVITIGVLSTILVFHSSNYEIYEFTLTLVTFLFLGKVLFHSFNHRGLSFIGFISLIMIFCAILSQDIIF